LACADIWTLSEAQAIIISADGRFLLFLNIFSPEEIEERIL
jgi:hypothetical protein